MLTAHEFAALFLVHRAPEQIELTATTSSR
jgi:hypothetical protein